MKRMWILACAVLVVAPAAARAGSETLDPEEDPEVAAAEAVAAAAEAEAPLPDYLTPLYSWAPPGTVQLKDAAVCHHIYGDWYGIAASYHVHGEHYDQDELWYVVVDGLSTWPSYGQFVTSARIDTFKEIRAVDCATDGTSSYVTWDRFYDYGSYYYYHKARLTRVQLDGYGNPSWPTPVEVGAHCGGGVPPVPETNYAGTPRVAWEPGGRLLVAFTTRRPNGDATGCVLCVEAFNASTLAYVAANSLWGDLSQYPSFDVEWNGLSRFVVFHLFKADGSPTGDFMTALFDRDAVLYGPAQLIDTGFMPQKTVLIFSNNSRNTYSRLLAFTKKKTYWIYQSGGKRGEYSSGTDRWYFGACEYWGPNARSGHSYTSWGTGYTYHQHWPTIPGGPLDTYHVSAYLPLTCSSADTFTDPEVIVISWTGLDPSRVYWNLEVED